MILRLWGEDVIGELERYCPSVFSTFLGLQQLLSCSLSFFSTMKLLPFFLPKKFERRGAFILNHQGPILQRGRILIVSRNNFLALLITRVSQQLKTKGVLQKRKVTWLCLKNKRRLTGFQQKVFTSCYIIKVNEC